MGDQPEESRDLGEESAALERSDRSGAGALEVQGRDRGLRPVQSFAHHNCGEEHSSNPGDHRHGEESVGRPPCILKTQTMFKSLFIISPVPSYYVIYTSMLLPHF